MEPFEFKAGRTRILFTSFIVMVIPDRIRAKKAQASMLKAASSGRTLLSTTLKPSELDPERLLFDLRSPSLFGDFPVYIIENAHQCTSAQIHSLMKGGLTETSGGIVLFHAEKLTKASTLRKYAEKNQLLYELEPLEGAELERWAAKTMSEISKKSLTLNAKSTQFLINVAHGEPERIEQLCEQVDLYFGSGHEPMKLTVEHLSQLFSAYPEAHEFELMNSIESGSPLDALILLHTLLQKGTNVFGLLGLLYRNYSNYQYISLLMMKRETISVIAKKVRLPEWLVKKHIASIRRYRKYNFRSELLEILKAASLLRSRNGGQDAVMESLIFALSPIQVNQHLNL